MDFTHGMESDSFSHSGTTEYSPVPHKRSLVIEKEQGPFTSGRCCCSCLGLELNAKPTRTPLKKMKRDVTCDLLAGCRANVLLCCVSCEEVSVFMLQTCCGFCRSQHVRLHDCTKEVCHTQMTEGQSSAEIRCCQSGHSGFSQTLLEDAVRSQARL